MDPEFPLALAKVAASIGEDLAAFSVAELQLRISDLEAEIGRVRAELARKQASLGAADALFRL